MNILLVYVGCIILGTVLAEVILRWKTRKL